MPGAGAGRAGRPVPVLGTGAFLRGTRARARSCGALGREALGLGLGRVPAGHSGTGAFLRGTRPGRSPKEHFSYKSLVVHRSDGPGVQSGDRTTRRLSRIRSLAEQRPGPRSGADRLSPVPTWPPRSRLGRVGRRGRCAGRRRRRAVPTLAAARCRHGRRGPVPGWPPGPLRRPQGPPRGAAQVPPSGSCCQSLVWTVGG